MMFAKYIPALPIISFFLMANSAVAMTSQQHCLLEGIEAAQPNTTAEEIRKACETKTLAHAREDAVEYAIRAERQSFDRDYTLTPHQPNFVLPITYNANPNEAPFEFTGITDPVQKIAWVR